MESSAKISAAERESLSKSAAVASQRAYAPRQQAVADFLSAEAQVGKACPSCDDKDYSDSCPLGWSQLTDGRCEAPSTYHGQCGGIQSFMGSSAAAKMELELTCGVCWPCSKGAASCERDWAQPCPNGFSPQDIAIGEHSASGGPTCAADLFYEGECEQLVTFNDLQSKQEFADRCQTSWPCKQACKGPGCSAEAKSASFLAARVLPVDAYKVRNSLFLSQVLRMPAAAAINVVENEDAARMYEEAKYKAMQGQGARLDRQLEDKLLLLAKA